MSKIAGTSWGDLSELEWGLDEQTEFLERPVAL
jgi:hypothetical protein